LTDSPACYDLGNPESVTESVISVHPVADQTGFSGILTGARAIATRRLPLARAAEWLGACLALIFVAPLLLALLLLLGLQNQGPVITSDWRIGRDGKRFRCWRLGAARAREPNSWLDQFLYLSRLEYLPRLLNVIAGDLSLIGKHPILDDEI